MLGRIDFLPARAALLAPMAGYTDLPYRTLCKDFGCDFAYTEMVSAKGLVYGGEGSRALLALSPDEGRAGVQIFGSEPEIMARAAREIARDPAVALIDINMGCPVPKVVNNGEGSALMKNVPLAAAVVAAVVAAVDIPVTVKLRKGFDAEHVNCAPLARALEQSGAALVTVHGRTRAEMYSGAADLDAIASVKAAVYIPVIGNGDICSGADAVRMLCYTRCDGVMVGRGAIGNPFIFREIKAALSGAPYAPPSTQERIDAAIEHITRLVSFKGDRALVEIRKHLPHYVRGMRGAAAFRVAANALSTPGELVALLQSYRARLEG